MEDKQYKKESQPMESQLLNAKEDQGNNPLEFRQLVYQQDTNNLLVSLLEDWQYILKSTNLKSPL